LLQTFFYDFFENSSDELGTVNTCHFRKSIVNNLLILLRYTVIIYKFTQGNIGTRSRFQSPVKKENCDIGDRQRDPWCMKLMVNY
jgi:hypothetical protein